MPKLTKMNDSIPIFTSVDQVIRDTYTYLGIDTEMRFAVNGKTVWPHLEGLKQERSNFERSADWHGDGYAFELCTLPEYCLETLHISLSQGFREILQVLKDRHSNASEENILVLPNCLFKVPMSVQDSAPDVVKRLGCSASMNVYGDGGDPDKLGQSVRTTGCHLHITHDSLNDDEKLAYALVRWADILVGNTWNFISPESSKKEALRRVAYGRAGEFRTRTYPMTRNS